MAMDSATHESESRNMKLLCSFADDRWTKNRSVTAVDWSHIVSLTTMVIY